MENSSKGKKKKKAKTTAKKVNTKGTKPGIEEGATITHEGEKQASELKIEDEKGYSVRIEEKDKEKKGVKDVKPERDETIIPQRYYDNKIVLMVRDPYWCYVYWDITAELMAQKSREIKPEWGNYNLALRVYDITDMDFNGNNAHKFHDIGITDDANNWYINVWAAGRSYVVDIGFKTEKGQFIVIARSNTVEAPRDSVSNVVDEKWMVVDADFDEILRLSGGGQIGSSERLHGSFEQNLFSESVSSFSSPAGGAKEEKGFFLMADTELILYGATEKDAHLKVRGEPVKLNPDGSFSMRFHLPDSTMEMPVEAISADASERIEVKITVIKSTIK